MEVIILEDQDQVCDLAASYIKDVVTQKKDACLGLATGSTPEKMYQKLVEWHKQGEVSFAKVKAFNLDEYVGLSSKHRASYFSYMRTHFFDHIDMDVKNQFIPNGKAQNIFEECENYEQKIKEYGGVDLQVLGIGRDGHIGFNEPSSSLSSRTRLKTLTEQTRKDNSIHFSSLNEVPHHVITMGIGTIMDTKQVALLAFGSSKAQAIADMVEGPVSAMCPASALQYHQNVKVIIDTESASKLKRKEYYNWVYTRKPQWQKIKNE